MTLALQAEQYAETRTDYHELYCGNPNESRLHRELQKAFVAGAQSVKVDLTKAREALKRALPILEEHAEDEGVFWGGSSHYIAKDAIEVFEQARDVLATREIS